MEKETGNGPIYKKSGLTVFHSNKKRSVMSDSNKG